jgi:hypothetical protein
MNFLLTFKSKQFIPTFKFLIQNTKFERIETSLEFTAASRLGGSGGLRARSRAATLGWPGNDPRGAGGRATVAGRHCSGSGGRATAVGLWWLGDGQGGPGRLADEEAMGRASKREATTVCVQGGGGHERNRGGCIRKTEEGTWQFPNRPIFVSYLMNIGRL